MNFGVPLRIIICTDGAARGNPGPSASGYTISDAHGKLIEANSVYNGLKTNNYAEYNAVIQAFEWCISHLKEHKEIEVELFSDSELIVNQLTGRYKVKSKDLLHLNEKAKQLSTRFKSVEFNSIPREDERISRVDSALNRLLDTLEDSKDLKAI
jgi:ribonuclease HI